MAQLWMTLIIIIVALALVFGGGGAFYNGGAYRTGGLSIGAVLLLALLVLYLTGYVRP